MYPQVGLILLYLIALQKTHTVTFRFMTAANGYQVSASQNLAHIASIMATVYGVMLVIMTYANTGIMLALNEQ